MKLLKFIIAISVMAVFAPAALAGEAAENDGKKQIYIINGKRAEPFDPTTADMSAFKNIGSNAKKVAQLAAQAGISEQELSENEVIFLKSKKPMYIASAGQSVDYTGTVSCEGNNLSNIYIMTRDGKTNADGKFACRVKYGTKGYIVANGYKRKRVTFSADLRKKITLNPVGFKSDTTDDKKQPRYSIVNGVYVRTFDISNYEPDEIISAKQVWEVTDEVRIALSQANIKPKFAEQYGAEVVTLRDGIQLADYGHTCKYELDIRDRDGNPVSGANIFIEKTRTDLHGNFTLTADCGTKAMAMHHTSIIKPKRFKLGAVPTLHLELERNPQNDATDNKPVIKADVMPKYLNGDLMTFREWVMNSITYPQEAKKLGIEGRVLVAFVINTEGYIQEIKVLESPHEKLSEEVVKILKRSKRWTPGNNAGQPVNVRFVLPVDFRIP